MPQTWNPPVEITTTLKPGWLGRTIHEAAISIRAGNDRAAAAQFGNQDPYPLSYADADELARRMDERFRSWTGRSLQEHFATRESVSSTKIQEKP